MKIDTNFLKTRVARRIFLLFFACALIPIAGAAAYSYIQVSSELREQSRTRLRETVRATEGAIFERLRFIDAELRGFASDLRDGAGNLQGLSREDTQNTLGARFRGLSIVTPSGVPTHLFGTIDDPPVATELDRQHLSTGRSILVTAAMKENQPIFMGWLIDPGSTGGNILWAQLEPSYLFGAGEDHPALPSNMQICVFDGSNKPLYCVVATAAAPLARQLDLANASRGSFEWTDGSEEYSASYRSLFLNSTYAPRTSTTSLRVVLSESSATVLQPMADFKKSFPFVILLVLLVVLLVSNFQIKKSMDPLVRLREGTQRIAKRDFGTLVEVNSGDEFEDLATSFNSMAGRLQSQFNTLTALQEIDQAVLSAQNIDRIIDTVLAATRRV
ncbi:MAG: HAMP domain-containing protein, partial [Gemmatimonadetes bacterium]|nr:HAMP domain-containing protein [Gemmatimonadota bacterium]